MATTFDLRNKVSVITGSAQGLGKGFADAILRRGGKVLLADVKVETGAITCSEFEQKYGKENVSFFKCDVTIQSNAEELIQQAVKRFDRIDVVINNAGIVNESYERFETCIHVNLTAMIRITKLAVDYFKKNGGGVIINVGSSIGIVPMSDMGVYCATKAGVINFTKAMARTCGMKDSGVRINVLCPWAVRTTIAEDVPKTEDYDVSIKQYGWMSLETVAEAMMSLITDETANGVILEVSENFGATRRDDIFQWPI